MTAHAATLFATRSCWSHQPCRMLTFDTSLAVEGAHRGRRHLCDTVRANKDSFGDWLVGTRLPPLFTMAVSHVVLARA